MKAIAMLLISGVLTYNGFIPANTPENSVEVPAGGGVPVEEQLGEVTDVKGPLVRFANLVDGYEISVPENMKADMSLSGIRTVFTNPTLTLEIYRETSNQASYINYSKGFINNTNDHTKEYETTRTIDDKKAVILQWSRLKLPKVANDKNYYATIDIIAGNNEVYTLFFKSTRPFWEIGGYDYIANTFKQISKTATPVMEQFPNKERPNWNLETKNFYKKHFSPDSELTWGIYEPSAPEAYNILMGLQTNMDYQFPFVVSYENILKYSDLNIKNNLDKAYQNGAAVELTLQTVAQQPGEGNMIYDVLEGKYDVYLNSFAAQVSSFGHPVLFRLANEMNGDWCEYSSYHTSRDTDIYKAFYTYIYDIFEKAGANENTLWVWNPHDKSFPGFKWNHETMYYPGDEYVDIIGMTGYNNGTYYKAEKWRTFTQIYDEMYKEYCRQYTKPFMITEFASSSVGGSKEAWVEDMFDQIKKYDKIKAAIWWNGRDLDANGNVARPYWINETPELTQIFKKRFAEFK